MKPMGFYHYIWAYPGLMTKRPYYGRREVGLISIKRDVTQILLPVLGEMTWINVDPADLS